MKEYNYQYFKTAKKTAKENNLFFFIGASGNKDLFDFSLLDTMEIPEEEKDVVKEHALKNVSVASRESWYGKQFDSFHICNGNALYHAKRIYSSATGKLLYRIFILVKIKHVSGTRNNIWERCFQNKEYKSDNGYDDSYYDNMDIEI